MKKHWFKAKTYGWGWYPSSWQGWVVMSIWLLLNIPLIMLLKNTHSTTETVLISIGMASLFTILLVICFTKGERPRWRWGN